MARSNSNNNEAYKLLELTDHSDSDLDLPELVSSPRRKVQRRKLKRVRKLSTSTIGTGNVESVCMCNVRIFTVWVAAILLTIWIITLTWLVIVLHNEIQRLDSAVRQVVASSQGVPDALQKCHTISKSLQNNQTLIINQINELKAHLGNYNKNVSEMQVTLNLIEGKLHSVPEYVDVPQQLKQVSSSIASFGSQIKDITSTVATLRTSKEQLETTNYLLIQNITALTNSVINLQNQSQTPLTLNTQENNVKIENILKTIEDIKHNLTNINSTLSSNVMWLQGDLKSNKINVETISNVGQNMSARVSTLEGLCGKSVTQNMLSTNLKGVYDELKNITNNIERQALQMNDIQMQVFQLTQNSSDLSSAINTLNQSLTLDEKAKKDIPSLNINTNKTVIKETVTETVAPPVPVTTSVPLVSSSSSSKAAKNPTAKPSILTP